MAHATTPIIQLKDIGKNFGAINALRGVNLTVRQGEVTCILGDNGAGKSTLISIVAGLYPHDAGEYFVDGAPRRFSSPREALDLGIAAVYQTLALVPLLPVWRNFFLGSELVKGRGVLRRLDAATMLERTRHELYRMGIDLENLEQPAGTLSGGQRQVLAIARAIHFGARVLILDEPTAALGVAQSGLVLRYVVQAARGQGLGVIFISHNPNHAFLVGDHFMVLSRGEVEVDTRRSELTLEKLMFHMAGGKGLSTLEHEIHGGGAPAAA
jgi:simple sugar transport system ATP-binding protein